MIRNLVVALVILAGGYGYWSSQNEVDPQIAEQKVLENNARRMRECLNREQSMNAAAGIDTVEGVDGDSKALCAEKLGLYSVDEEWRELGVFEENTWD